MKPTALTLSFRSIVRCGADKSGPPCAPVSPSAPRKCARPAVFPSNRAVRRKFGHALSWYEMVRNGTLDPHFPISSRSRVSASGRALESNGKRVLGLERPRQHSPTRWIFNVSPCVSEAMPRENRPAPASRALFFVYYIIWAEFSKSTACALKKSAITHSIRLLQNKIRECAISLLIMNTRAFLSLIVGINLAKALKRRNRTRCRRKAVGPP